MDYDPIKIGRKRKLGTFLGSFIIHDNWYMNNEQKRCIANWFIEYESDDKLYNNRIK
jgi:hypothetical protein